MNKYFAKIHNWFTARSPRERIFFFILGIIFVYMCFSLFFLKPLSNQKKELNSQIDRLKTEISADRQQINIISTAVKDGTLINSLGELNKLQVKLKQIHAAMIQLKTELVTATEPTRISKTILNLQVPNVILKNIKNFPPVPWQINVRDRSDLSHVVTTDIVQYDFQLELQSDYFNTIEYLKNLEKISPYIYWDNLYYKVTQYPTASVTLKFHLLMNETS